MGKRKKNQDGEGGSIKASPLIGKNLPTKTFHRDRVNANPGELFDPNTGYGRSVRRPGSVSWDNFLEAEGIKKKGLSKEQKAYLERQWEAQGGGHKMDWLLTDAGRNFATNEPDAYTNALMARAGGVAGPSPLMGGPTQFGQFLANDYRDMLDAGYDAALLASGGRLGRADYMNSIGWGARANQNGFMLPPQPPVDTGNPFTSSSLPTPGVGVAGGGKNPDVPALPKWKDWLTSQGYTPGKEFRENVFKEDREELKTLYRNPNAALSTTGGGVNHARRAYLSLTPQQRGINSATGFKPGRWAIY